MHVLAYIKTLTITSFYASHIHDLKITSVVIATSALLRGFLFGLVGFPPFVKIAISELGIVYMKMLNVLVVHVCVCELESEPN